MTLRGRTGTPTVPAALSRGSGKKASPGHDVKAMKRQRFVLWYLTEHNVTYDEMIRIVMERFPWPRRWLCATWAVRAVRAVLWDELAVTQNDETLWLTPAGWSEQSRRVALKKAAATPCA